MSKDKISNDERVLAYTESGEKIPYLFGKLKDDFISKKITKKIKKVYSVRQKVFYFVKYKATKGFKFERIEGTVNE